MIYVTLYRRFHDIYCFQADYTFCWT